MGEGNDARRRHGFHRGTWLRIRLRRPGVASLNAAEPTASLEVALAHTQRLLAHDPVLAEEQAHEILRSMPGQPVALRLLAAPATGPPGRRSG